MQAAQSLRAKADGHLIDNSYLFGLIGSPPDHLLANASYQAAGVSFRNLKRPIEAIACFLAAGHCLVELGSFYLAGKQYETAGHISNKADATSAMGGGGGSVVFLNGSSTQGDKKMFVENEGATDVNLPTDAIYCLAGETYLSSGNFDVGCSCYLEAAKYVYHFVLYLSICRFIN